MPKVPETTRLQRFKSEFSDLDIRNGELFCRFCEKKVSFFFLICIVYTIG